MTAVFEAVVNAVAHRDYSVHGSKIRLRLFSDRLELYSPGGAAERHHAGCAGLSPSVQEQHGRQFACKVSRTRGSAGAADHEGDTYGPAW